MNNVEVKTLEKELDVSCGFTTTRTATVPVFSRKKF